MLLTLGFVPGGWAPAADANPNIVFIFADDWGWGDLGCHGHPYLRTPNIDRLAREGTDFHRFTVASGVCSPSRTAVMTGHFPARYNIDGHFAWVPSNARRNMPDWLDTDCITLPRLLQGAGYATAHFGKWHLANDMIPDSPSPSAPRRGRRERHRRESRHRAHSLRPPASRTPSFRRSGDRRDSSRRGPRESSRLADRSFRPPRPCSRSNGWAATSGLCTRLCFPITPAMVAGVVRYFHRIRCGMWSRGSRI